MNDNTAKFSMLIVLLGFMFGILYYESISDWWAIVPVFILTTIF
jgi:hypothetical protein